MDPAEQPDEHQRDHEQRGGDRRRHGPLEGLGVPQGQPGLSLRYAETLQWPMAAAVSAALLVIALVLIWLLSRVHDLRKEV